MSTIDDISATNLLCKKSLLIVDNFQPINKVLARVFSGRFDSIFTARIESDAEKHLQQNHISHVVISNNASETCTTAELVERWKRQYPSIRRVVLFTGASDSNIDFVDAFDAVLTKPCENSVLIRVVEGEFPN